MPLAVLGVGVQLASASLNHICNLKSVLFGHGSGELFFNPHMLDSRSLGPAESRLPRGPVLFLGSRVGFLEGLACIFFYLWPEAWLDQPENTIDKICKQPAAHHFSSMGEHLVMTGRIVILEAPHSSKTRQPRKQTNQPTNQPTNQQTNKQTNKQARGTIEGTTANNSQVNTGWDKHRPTEQMPNPAKQCFEFLVPVSPLNISITPNSKEAPKKTPGNQKVVVSFSQPQGWIWLDISGARPPQTASARPKRCLLLQLGEALLGLLQRRVLPGRSGGSGFDARFGSAKYLRRSAQVTVT